MNELENNTKSNARQFFLLKLSVFFHTNIIRFGISIIMSATDESICKKFVNKKLAALTRVTRNWLPKSHVMGYLSNQSKLTAANQKQNQTLWGLGLRAFSRLWRWLHLSSSSSDSFITAVTCVCCDWITISFTCITGMALIDCYSLFY